MPSSQEIEGGIQILDAESVDLCPWVEFYPDLISQEEADELLVVACSAISSIHQLGITKLEADFARIETRKSGEVFAMKFGTESIADYTSFTLMRMLAVDVSPLLELGEKLDGLVDFQNNGEVVIYREEKSIGFHIDGNKKRPLGARRCLLTLFGSKTNSFEHPETKQIISSRSGAGSALTISYGAIRHAISRDDETYSVYIQSDK